MRVHGLGCRVEGSWFRVEGLGFRVPGSWFKVWGLLDVHQLLEQVVRDPPEAGSYLRLMDSHITRLNAQRPARTCNESKAEEERCDLHLT